MADAAAVNRLLASGLERAKRSLYESCRNALKEDGSDNGVKMSMAIAYWSSVLAIAAEIVMQSNPDNPEPEDSPVRIALLDRIKEHLDEADAAMKEIAKDIFAPRH